MPAPPQKQKTMVPVRSANRSPTIKPRKNEKMEELEKSIEEIKTATDGRIKELEGKLEAL